MRTALDPLLAITLTIAIVSTGGGCSAGAPQRQSGERTAASLSLEGSRAFWRMSSDPGGTKFSNFYIVQVRITNTEQTQFDFDYAEGWFRDARAAGPGESAVGTDAGRIAPGKTMSVTFDSSHSPERDFNEFVFTLLADKKAVAGPFRVPLPRLQSLPVLPGGGPGYPLAFEGR